MTVVERHGGGAWVIGGSHAKVSWGMVSLAAGGSPKATYCSIAGLVDDAEDGRDAIMHGGINALKRPGL